MNFRTDNERRKAAEAEYALGMACSTAIDGDRQTNLEKAIAYFKSALDIYTLDIFPVEWANVLHELGMAYSSMPREDRQTNLRNALGFFQSSLEVYTREAFPASWARTQYHLGMTY